MKKIKNINWEEKLDSIFKKAEQEEQSPFELEGLKDFIRQNFIEKKEIEKTINELGNDPPIESNEIRRAYHQALSDLHKELLENDKI